MNRKQIAERLRATIEMLQGLKDKQFSYISYVSAFSEKKECGTIWTMLQNGDTFESKPVHTENWDMIDRMCMAMGIEYSLDRYDETWSYLTVKSLTI